MKQPQFVFLSVALLVVFGNTPRSRGQDASDVDAVFQRLDKNGDGKVSASEIPEDQSRYFERLLRKANKDANGELTRDEFRQASKPEERPNVQLNRPDPEQARDEARQRFEMLDRNKDGKLTLDEVPEQLRERLKPMFDRLGKQELTVDDFLRMAASRPDPAEVFKRFDANADGKLSRDELPAEMRERLGPVFDRAGKNELSLEEFSQGRGQARDAGGRRPDGQQAPEDMFARLDTNSDGKLTADEAPERARPMIENILKVAGKDREGSLTKEEFVKNFSQPVDRGGARRADGDGRPGAERDNRSRDANASGERDAGRGGDMPREGRGPVVFRLLDANKDGHVSKEEFAKITEMFDQLDRNHDGQLDPQELVGLPPGAMGRRADQGVPGERDSSRSEGSRGGGERSTNGNGNGDRGPVFQRLDRDGDGKISKDEAPPFLKDRFAMFDTNGDGFVSQEEFRSGAQLLGEPGRNRRSE